jgi:hypothetical protein
MSDPEPPRRPRTTATSDAAKAAREARLAQEMRTNLHKRKARERALAQARARRGDEPPRG